MAKDLNVRWKKAVIQMAKEMKKANQLTALIGNGLLRNKLDNINDKKSRPKKVVEKEGLSYVR